MSSSSSKSSANSLTGQRYQSCRERAISKNSAILIVMDSFQKMAFKNTAKDTIKIAAVVLI